MRDRLIELILNTPVLKFPSGSRAQGKTYQTAQNFANHLLANGVIVPPCKVGDIVYRVSFVHKTVESLKVEGFLCNLASWKAHCTHLIPSWLGNKKEHFYISFSSFGKTVFLTCKDAEKVLAERSKE